MKKRIKIITIALIALMVILLGIIGANSFGENKIIYKNIISHMPFMSANEITLATPDGLTWKEESTATATWNAVDNANYYIINVYLYNQSYQLVESIQTGTATNELDLQQEIYNLLSGRTIDNYFIDYDVTAWDIADDYSIYSNVSEKCEAIIIENAGKTTLATPTNVALSDNFYASWSTTDSLSNIWFFGFDWKFEYNGDIKYVSGTGTSTAKNGTKVNVSSQIKSAYDEAGFSGETVKVAIRVKSWANYDTDYKNSEPSEYSNYVEYSSTGKTTLATPTNVALSDNFYASWSTTDSLTDIWFFGFDWKFEYNGDIKYVSGTGTSTAKNGTKVNVSSQIKSAYDEAGFSGETVKVAIRVKSWANYDTDYKNGEPSEYSNYAYYNPNGSTVINSITLSPNKPVIAVGRTMYIGKIIEPNNAYYSSINWETSDSSIVSISDMGQISGIKKGNATITAQINNATQSAEVSVYEIESNISNSNEANQVINEANNAIESITTNGDITNTDITDRDAAIDEIEQGAQNGDMFNVDIKYDYKTANEYSDIKDRIDSKFDGYNIAGGNDIKIAISHTDKNGSEHHITNITELEKEVSVKFDMSANIPKLSKTKTREYKLVRCHNENMEDVDFEINNGIVETSSDQFSDFVLLYKDTDKYTDTEIRDIVNNIPKYYVFDMEKFQSQECDIEDIAEYTSQQLEKYIKQEINDDSIEISVDNLQGGGDFTFMEWSADVNIYKDEILYDTVHFGWEDESYITVFALITIPSNIENTEEAYIEYAQNIIENKYNWSIPYKIEKYDKLRDKDIVLLDTNKFGTIEYKGEDISSSLYAYIPEDDPDLPEPVLLMQESDESPTFSISGDINEDGKISVLDINYGLRKLSKGEITIEEIKQGDVTEDGKFTILDINKVLRYLSGKIKEL